jgi:hypothetical protein
MSSYGGFICLACGNDLPRALRLTVSLRCDGCREVDAPVHVAHARRARARNRSAERPAA